MQYKNFVYRDLKPNNIIIDQNRNPILIDFDRMVNVRDEINENTTKDFYNDFMFPEIFYDCIVKYTFKEDIYSIGAIMLFMLYK